MRASILETPKEQRNLLINNGIFSYGAVYLVF